MKYLKLHEDIFDDWDEDETPDVEPNPYIIFCDKYNNYIGYIKDDKLYVLGDSFGNSLLHIHNFNTDKGDICNYKSGDLSFILKKYPNTLIVGKDVSVKEVKTNKIYHWK